MTDPDRSVVGRFIGSVVALVLVGVAIPVGLVAASRHRFGSANPLSGADPPWRWFSDTSGFAEPIAEDTFVDGLLRACICVAWLAIAVIVATTVVETVHLVRHRGLPAPTFRGFGWAQAIARPIAVGLLVVLPTATSSLSVATAIPSARTASAASTSWVGEGAAAHDSEVAADTGGQDRPHHHDEWAGARGTGAVAEAASNGVAHHVVASGESVYSIAERLAAGIGAPTIEVANAIVDLNLGRAMGPGERFTNPAYVQVGWQLEIPARFARAQPAVGVSRPDVASSVVLPRQAPEPVVHIVVPGDTLWDIAGAELGDPTAWPAIWQRNAGRVMDDGRTFDDPDLIVPGWRLEIPAAPTNGGQPDPAPVESPEPIESPVITSLPSDPAPADSDAPDGPDGSGDRSSGVTDVDPDVSDDGSIVDPDLPILVSDAPILNLDDLTDPPATSTPAAPTSSAPSSIPPVDGGADAADDPPPGSAPTAPSPIRLEHAALLAAGILAVVAVRRRQRLRAARPRHRVPQPDPEVIDTERRLRAVDAGERALRIDVACRAAAVALLDSGAQIGWVTVSADGEVDLRLTAPATLPPPWTGRLQSWRLGAEVPIELLAADARHGDAPCVALVQVGVTPCGRDVLVDLEACGCLAIEATPRQGDEIITAIGAGLASSLSAEVAHLIGVSLPAAALLGHRNAHAVDTTDAAFELALSLVGSTVTNEATTFELRSRHSGGEVWEPAIALFTAADSESATGDGRLTPPIGHGLAVVAVVPPGALPTARVRLSAQADGWRLTGFDGELDVTPIGLGRADLAAIDAVLRDADRELESMELVTADEIRWSDDEVTDATPAVGEPEESSVPFAPMPHEVVVSLLGAVAVTDRHGDPGLFERSKTVELIAWLVTHRDRATRTGARTALWEMDVRDATFANVVSEARRALARLVDPPDGEEWIARTLTEQLPVHDLVVTDAELMSERLDGARLQPPAQAIETLRPAVAMIRDMPFAGTSYLWPDAEGITSNLVLLAISVTTEFAGHALSLGDTDGVFWATGHGLRVLPGHEELIALRMRAHARAGDLAGVRNEWESYERVLVADAWSDGEPSPKLLALRRELLTN